MSEVDDLRAEVARLRRAATRKISRIKTIHGARVSGTEFDPRRSTGKPARYTQAQLESYRSQLASFLSRGNQYVPDASARPVPRREYVAYKAQEEKYRRAAGNVYETIKNVELPSGETISQRLAKMNVAHRQMHNPAVNMIFDPHARKSDDIVSREAMQKLMKSMQRNSSPSAIKRKIQEARDQFKAMMDVINMPELFDAAKNLTDAQFVAAWNYGGLAAAISLSYSSAKKMLSPKEETWAHDRLRQQMGDAMELIDWAHRIQA